MMFGARSPSLHEATMPGFGLLLATTPLEALTTTNQPTDESDQ